MENRISITKQTKYKIIILLYIVTVHILMIAAYGDTFSGSYKGLLFVYDFNILKYFFALFENVIMTCAVFKKLNYNGMTEKVTLFLDLLYFIPGTVQQATTNATFEYMIFFFLFWIGMQLWTKIIKAKSVSLPGKYFRLRNSEQYILGITLFAIFLIILFGLYTGKSISIANILNAFNNVYEVRAEAKEQAVHWIIIAIEYFSAYILMLMITYYTEKRNWIIVIMCIVAEINVFIFQANRIIMFLSIVALIIGLIKGNDKKIYWGFFVLTIVLITEVCINSRGWIFTDVFRRYSIVPNRLGEQYFDFFKTHTPDYLRSQYSRISSLLGVRSEYYQPSIGAIIGQKYYGSDMNANTGLVGGGVFMFGYAAPIITTFGYVMSFRMFENVSKRFEKTSVTTCLAIILATLAINTGSLLANIFSISYIMLLYLALIPVNIKCITNTNKTTKRVKKWKII